MDFWVVKNVTGRIMAGLRWWNYVDENGEARWIFESRGKDSEHVHSSTEIKIFWGTLVLTPLVWILFIFTYKFPRISPMQIPERAHVNETKAILFW
ncbi:unnamed protein product [Lepeophtheirus salmonis]|nr:unnamed protein product [Lepeophtheirus salmonis]